MFFTYSIRVLLGALAVSALGLLLTANVVEAVGPDPATNCEVTKLKAAGKKAACLAKQEARALLGKPSNPTKCEEKFTTAFQKAETKAGPGVCPTEGDVAGIEALVDTCVEDIAAALSGSPPAPCGQFPATGQATAYQADKNDGIAGAVDVPDDGTVQAGATLSYTDNGDGTITDNNTGLMWEKKSDDSGLHDKDNLYRWSGDGSQETIWDWLEDINAEGGTGFAGHNDWRIPNAKELQSIVDYGRFNPSIDPIFGPTMAPVYWSSTSYAVNLSFAWTVYFSGGFVNALDKSSTHYVRAVRGGQ
jgi:hypothetical protein